MIQQRSTTPASAPPAHASRGPVVGLDIGGTQVRAAVVDDGQLGPVTSLPTPANDGTEAVVATICQAIDHVRTREVTGVGISAAGVIDPVRGLVVSATDIIRGWAGTPLAEAVANHTGLDVRVVNDVHGHALGELHHGAGRGASSMLLVAAGTGLGGAWVSDGQLVTGAHHLAGHLGHVPSPQAVGLPCSCGATGHLESVASGSGLEALHRHLHPAAAPVPGRTIARFAADGDVAALKTITCSGEALGAAIGGWCNLLDPDVVVITGGLANAGDAWWHALHHAHQDHALPGARATPLVRAQHPDHAALLGAATLFTHPLTTTGEPR